MNTRTLESNRLPFKDHTIHLLRRMVQTPSLTEDREGYKAMASILSREMEAMGFRTEWTGVEPGKPNVVGVMNPGAHPSLLFNGHIDTVPPGPRNAWEKDPFGGELEGDRLFGRGACDMKGGLAAMMMGTKIFLESKPKMRGSLILTATVDEEIGGFDGLKYLINQSVRADFGIVCEPTDLEIVNVSKGLIWIKLETGGREAHGSMPGLGINAITKMTKLLSKLEHDPPASGTHPLLGQSTFNTGVILGGTKPNIVPGACEAQIDVRYLPSQNYKDVVNQIERVIHAIKAEDPDFSARAEVIRYRIPVEVPESAEIVQRVLRVVEEVTGNRPKLRGMVSPADMEHLFKAGISSIMFGPGSDSLAHQPNEWISVDSVFSGALIYASIMADILT